MGKKIKKTKIEEALELLNRVGGTSKLDYFRQDYKYHDLWERIVDFVKRNDIYPDELSKQMRVVKDSVVQRQVDDYKRAYPFNNMDDFFMDLDIMTAYATVCEWLKEYNGQERLDAYLEEAYGKIKAAALKLGFDEKPEATTMSSPEEMLMKKAKREQVNSDELVDELCERNIKTVEICPFKFIEMKDILEDTNDMSKDKRMSYGLKLFHLDKFFSERGVDVGTYKLSEDLYFYWRKTGIENKAEIWLMCCCKHWEKEMAKLGVKLSDIDGKRQPIDEAKKAEADKNLNSLLGVFSSLNVQCDKDKIVGF